MAREKDEWSKREENSGIEMDIKTETKRKYEPFSFEDAKRLAKENEELIGKGFVKSDGFEKSIVLLMTLTNAIWKSMQESKSFRMELFYDEETLNTNYCFFVPANQCEFSVTLEEELQREINETAAPLADVQYDNIFSVLPDDEEKTITISPSTLGSVLKLDVKKAEVLAKIIQNQIQEWK